MATNDDAVEGLAEKFEKTMQQGRGGGGGGRKGGKQSKGAGSAADGGKNRESQISRALSRLLRHQALNAGIVLDKEGYAPLEKVVSHFLYIIYVGK